MTKFDPTTIAVNQYGEPMRQPKTGAKPDPKTGRLADEDLRERTLGDICGDALLAQSEQKIDAATQVRRFKLALLLLNATAPVELSARQVTEILDQIAVFNAPLLYGQVAVALGEDDESEAA